MKNIFILSVLLSFSVLGQSAAFNFNTHQLLWKISGKNLKKPSYLYGTMHITDEEVFKLSDSTFTALKNVDAFAGELNFESEFPQMLDLLFTQDTANHLKKHLSSEDYALLNEKVEKNIGYQLNEINTKETWILELFLKKKISTGHNAKSKQKSTMLDAYLYYYFKQQNKKVHGLENLGQYINWNKQFTEKENADRLVYQIKSDTNLITAEKASYEKLKDLYLKGDINALYDFVHKKSNEENSFILKSLVYRNLNMAHCIDSLIPKESIFITMGALHLAGDSGVINLLKKLGYTVTPVKATFNKKNTLPELKRPEAQWTDLAPENQPFKLLMPNTYFKKSNSNAAVYDFDLYSSVDMSNMNHTRAMFLGVGNSAETDDQKKKVFDNVLRNIEMRTVKKKISSKYFLNASPARLEAIFNLGKHYERYAIFFTKEGSLLLDLAGKKDYIYSADAEKIIQSVQLTNIPKKQNSLITLNESGLGFSTLIPEKHKKGSNVIDNEDNCVKYTYYLNTFPVDGITYAIYVYEYCKDSYLEKPQTAIQALIESYNENQKGLVYTHKDATLWGYTGCTFENKKVQNQEYTKGKIFCRDNRVYVYMASSNNANSELIDNFLEAFKPIPYNEKLETALMVPDSSFSINLPNNFKKDTSQYYYSYSSRFPKHDDSYIYTFTEPQSSVKYVVTHVPFNKYYITDPKKSIIDSIYEEIKDTTVIFDTTFNVNNLKIKEYYDSTEFGTFIRNRIYVTNHSAYMISLFGSEGTLRNKYTTEILNKFKPKPDLKNRSEIEVKKQFIKDLNATDSLTAENAYESISSIVFNSKDIPELKKIVSKNFPLDSAHYKNTRRRIWENLLSTNHDFNAFAENFYKENNANPDPQIDLLSSLLHTEDSLNSKLFAKLFINYQPKVDTVDMYNFNVYRLDTYSKDIFPFAYTLLNHKVYSDLALIWTANALKDTLISANDVSKYSDKLSEKVENNILLLKSPTPSNWSYIPSSIFALLKSLNTVHSLSLLQQFLKYDDKEVKYNAFCQLVNTNETINPKEINILANDHYYRIPTYTKLKEVHKENLFPKKHLNQKSLAISSMVSHLDLDDYTIDTSSIQIIKEKIITHKGQKKKVYLLKFKLTDDETWYTGLSGFHNVNKNNLDAEFDACTSNLKPLEELSHDEHINDLYNNLLENAEE
ncbi:MAG: TraB/GumN family protein [Cytophagales bacterium]